MAISQFSMSAEPLQKIMPDFITIFHDTYWWDACLENRIQHKLQKTWIVLWNHVIPMQTNHRSRTDDARLFLMIDFLQKNYQKKFILDALCDHVNLSRSACCRYFKKMMNMSVSDYILEYRMSQALFLLDHSGLSITDIAFQCGFASTSYFIARFKEKMGVTPREYKLR